MKTLFSDRIPTAVGEMLLLVNERGHLVAAGWTGEHKRMDRQTAGYADGYTLVAAENPAGVTAKFARYLKGELAALDDIAVEALIGTSFQRDVWHALREIRVGTTCSYGDIARRIGRPNAVRAVGAANGANPIAVVVPCHRVIGADGSLTGYGGGMPRKVWLLGHESGQQVLQMGAPFA